MLRNGDQYLEGLRDGRHVCVGSEIVSDVTSHAAFRNAARTVASLYDAASENPGAFGYTDDGEVHNAIWLRPKTREDLQRRRDAHRGWADVSHGLVGRSPDHVAGYLTGMACEAGVAAVHGQGFDENVLAYWRHCRDHDLYLSYAVAPPARARAPEVMRTNSPGASGPPDASRSSALRVVSEDDNGITVWGTKILATASVFADELLIGNLLPLTPGEEAFAVTFATPVNAPGLKLIPRKPYEQYASNPLDDPLACRFDESDAVVFFNNVFVPWERVFTYGHLDTGLALFMNTPAHVLGNAQAHSRLLAKMQLTLGVIHRISELTGTAKIPAVREMLAARATELAVVQSLITAADAVPHSWPAGYVSPNLQTMYALINWSTETFPTFQHGIRELLGSQPFQIAADASVFVDAESAQLLVDAFGAESVEEARERYKLMKIAWDLIGSEFASRHLQYEMFYAGARHVTRARMAHIFDWASVDAVAERCVAELDSFIEEQTVFTTA